MATYKIEAYELWTSCYVTEADNAAEALKNFHEGNCDVEDNSNEFLELSEDCGIWLTDVEDPQVRNELLAGGFSGVLDCVRNISREED